MGDESFLNSVDMSSKTSIADSLPVVNVMPPVSSDQRSTLNAELLDLTEMLSGDLNTMERSSDTGFVGLDLHEASMHLGSGGNMSGMGGGDAVFAPAIDQTLNVPVPSQS